MGVSDDRAAAALADARRLEIRAAVAAALAPWPLVLGMTLLAIPIVVLTFVAAGLAVVKALRGRPTYARNWLGGVMLGTVSTSFMAAPGVRGFAQSLLALILIVGWPLGWSIAAIVALSGAETRRRLEWGREYRARQAANAARLRPPPPLAPDAPAPPEVNSSPAISDDDGDDLGYLDAIADSDDSR